MVILLSAAGWVIINQQPGQWPIETAVLILIGLSLFVGLAWSTGTKKWGLLGSGGVIAVLIMNRFGVLDWATFSLLLIVIGLISLLN